MAFQAKQLVVAIALSWVISMQRHSLSVNGTPEVPCFFIFGDSLADSGNNNLLDSKAKVNHTPYGIDFPGGATGRFTNGRTTVDFLSQQLRFDNFIPPFALINGSDILQGVNYASGASGIRNESGSHLGGRICMDEQLKNHEITMARIGDELGKNMSLISKWLFPRDKNSVAKDYLNMCLYSVGMGSNDYINNYFLPQHYDTSKKFNTTYEYAEALIQQYSQQIKKLHEYGARKVIVVGVGLIGCTPRAISDFGTNGSVCVDRMNLAAQQFNEKLVSLVNQLNKNLSDAKFIYINSFEMGSGNPKIAGFKVVNVSCCELNEVGQCKFEQTPCQNRSEYVFWDGFHPTESANQITAIRSYDGSINLNDTYPIDIRQLAQLNLTTRAPAS